MALDAVGDVGIGVGVEGGGEGGQEFRGLFEVGIDQEDTFAAGQAQAGEEGFVVSEVAGEVEDFDTGFGGAEFEGPVETLSEPCGELALFKRLK